MLKKKLVVAVLGAVMFSPVVLPPVDFSPAQKVFAEVQTLEADGYYIMGDGTEENQAVAKERARADAKRAASEQACTFVETISEIKNNNLTRDEILTISASILKILSDTVNPEISGGSIMFHCHITVAVDTSNVNEKLLQDRKKFDELSRQNKEQAEQIAKLSAEMDALKKKYSTASAEEKIVINAEVKRNESKFTSAQFLEKGNYYFDTEDYNKAITFYNQAIKLNPNNAEAWNNAASAYIKLNTYEKAFEYYRKSIEIDPENNILVRWMKEGNKYFDSEYYGNAIECYNKILELEPKHSLAWAKLGFSYSKLGNYKKAVECYDKAIELNPSDSNYKKWRDNVLEKMK